jgi:hypothetical protein
VEQGGRMGWGDTTETHRSGGVKKSVFVTSGQRIAPDI